jgi:hypothetical protein
MTAPALYSSRRNSISVSIADRQCAHKLLGEAAVCDTLARNENR